MEPIHFLGVFELQRLAFPPPFDQDILWLPEHLQSHCEKFPIGQFVALADGLVVGSCSNSLIRSELIRSHLTWDETVGGCFLSTFDPNGNVLFGVDISVHPDYRRLGIGRTFYDLRKELVKKLELECFSTTCRIPDFAESGYPLPKDYCQDVIACTVADRTLTPLLRYGLTMTAVLEEHMDDPESGNASVALEWRR